MNHPNKSFFKTLLHSFGFALKGIASMRNERNFRIELFIAIVAVALSIILKISTAELMLVLICIGLVLSLEMINTAIEKMCDKLLGKAFDEDIKTIKDIAAGAVFITAFIAAVIGLIIFIPYLF